MFRDPTPTEKALSSDLIGKRVEIFWDGDNIFYSGRIKGYKSRNGTHAVLYDNDETGKIYEENLRTSVWRVYEKIEKVKDPTTEEGGKRMFKNLQHLKQKQRRSSLEAFVAKSKIPRGPHGCGKPPETSI